MFFLNRAGNVDVQTFLSMFLCEYVSLVQVWLLSGFWLQVVNVDNFVFKLCLRKIDTIQLLTKFWIIWSEINVADS